MAQRVGMCIPSGCTVEDAATNYVLLYKNIGAWLKPQLIQLSLTEDYFFEGYLEGNVYDDFYNITPKYWTWGQCLYV